MATFQGKPAFVEYLDLLNQLHGLVDRGLGESLEAEAIRDRMDEPWRRLTDEEIAEIDRLSEEARAAKSGAVAGGTSAVPGTVGLTSQEVQLLQRIAVGKPSEIIAESLHISAETVREHLQNILRKIAVSEKLARERLATLGKP